MLSRPRHSVSSSDFRAFFLSALAALGACAPSQIQENTLTTPAIEPPDESKTCLPFSKNNLRGEKLTTVDHSSFNEWPQMNFTAWEKRNGIKVLLGVNQHDGIYHDLPTNFYFEDIYSTPAGEVGVHAVNLPEYDVREFSGEHTLRLGVRQIEWNDPTQAVKELAREKLRPATLAEGLSYTDHRRNDAISSDFSPVVILGSSFEARPNRNSSFIVIEGNDPTLITIKAWHNLDVSWGVLVADLTECRN